MTNSDAVVPAMAATVNYSRVTGLFLAVSMMVPVVPTGFYCAYLGHNRGRFYNYRV